MPGRPLKRSRMATSEKMSTCKLVPSEHLPYPKGTSELGHDSLVGQPTAISATCMTSVTGRRGGAEKDALS